jgi:crossover junction endodeoxyribonuclease RuvC
VIALGIDPGTRHLGWGVVRQEGNRMWHVAHGVIHTDASRPLADRLTAIDRELSRVVQSFRPVVGSVESLFFHKDAQAAAKLGHARGVVLLGLAREDVEIVEFAPAQVKRIVTGRGRADKRQVALMIRTLLSLDEVPPSDAADALALAVTYLRRAPLEQALGHRKGAEPDERLVKVLRGYRPKRRRRSPAPAGR